MCPQTLELQMENDRLRKRNYVVSAGIALAAAVTLVSVVTFRAIHAEKGDTFMLVVLPLVLWVSVAFIARSLWRGYRQIKD
jgi:hypothetical protein